MAVDFPVAQGPETISPRRALISRRFTRVSSLPWCSTSRIVGVSTMISSEW